MPSVLANGGLLNNNNNKQTKTHTQNTHTHKNRGKYSTTSSLNKGSPSSEVHASRMPKLHTAKVSK